ncbi:MAG: hypothetical protein J5I52_09870 [Saprospiraceae bacterium]|nr:MAG: hypothetical protein UZ09_BCD002001157 [Bacteroidetes bacterium OLB9]MCO6464440.1 hypothetical protein [Saprospiraceae bacterium]MCZ2338014.1 hypothetical protein [Chitinophagales bacterium]
MHDVDKKFVHSWEKTRSKGRWIYGLTAGLPFGVFIFIIVNLLNLKNSSFAGVFLTQRAMVQLIEMLVFSVIGFATVKWWMNENTYKKIIDREQNPTEMD